MEPKARAAHAPNLARVRRFALTLVVATLLLAACEQVPAIPQQVGTPSALVLPAVMPSTPVLSTVAPYTPAPVPSMTPGYRARLGTVERDITYCVADGVALKMDVYYPHTMNQPAPVAFYVHGGSWSAGNKLDSNGMVDVPELLARGYLVVSVDYRLAPEWKFPAQIYDVKCAVRFLRANASHFNLDPSHIGAWGHSAGGHLVALLGTTHPADGFEGTGPYADQSSRVQAVVVLSGRADLHGMPAHTAASVFGAQNNSSDLLTRDSPITYVSPDAPPFLILHGEKDGQVPLRVAQEFHDRFQAQGVRATLVVVKNGSHTFQPEGGPMSPTRAEMTRMIADFFDRHLR